MSKKIFWLIAILILAILGPYFADLLYCFEGFNFVRPLKINAEPIIHHAEKIPKETISEFIEEDNNVFILYEKTGLVNVYSDVGTFLFGIQVETTSTGHAHIAYANNHLLIQSRANTIYEFNNTEEVFSIDFNNTEYVNNTSYKSTYDLYETEFDKNDNHTFNGKTFTLSIDGYSLVALDNDSTLQNIVDAPSPSWYIAYIPLAILICVVITGIVIDCKAKSVNKK